MIHIEKDLVILYVIREIISCSSTIDSNNELTYVQKPLNNQFEET